MEDNTKKEEALPVIEFTADVSGTSMPENQEVSGTNALPVIEFSAPVGRPSKYSQEIADEICRQISQGYSLRKICLDEDMPSGVTIFSWLRTNEEFLKQYNIACEERVESQHEMIADIGDEAIDAAQEVDPKASGAVVNAYKLKADNLKWSMSKMKPKKYGDKVDVTSGGEAIKGNNIIIGDFKDAANNQ